jgi:hypothetical protein
VNILEEAGKTINQERMDEYGKPEDSFLIIAEYWTAYLKAKKYCYTTDELNSKDTAVLMSLFKIARMSGQKYSRDNPRDAIGYLAIYADRLAAPDKTLCNVRTMEEEEKPRPAFYPRRDYGCW